MAQGRAALRHPKHWPTHVGIGLLWLLGRLPFPLLWGLGMGLGRLGYFLAAGRRRVALRNLEICFPDLGAGARARLARRHFGWLGVAAMTQGVPWEISRGRLARLVRLRNREHIDHALGQGRSIILLVPHFVGLDLAGVAYGGLVSPGLFMYQRIRNPVVDARMRKSRMQFGNTAVERRDDLRALVRQMKAGQTFLYLPDQDAGKLRGIFVPFCGLPAATVPMLGRFARLADAVVIPTIARYRPWGRGLEVIFDPPLEPFPSGDAQADTALMNRVIEARMRTMPEQYFWVHRRFKTRPPGEPPVYPKGRRKR